MAIISPVTSNTRGGAYGANWGSVYSLELEPQVWKQWFQAYGNGFKIKDFLTIAGQTVAVQARDIDAFTDQALEKAVRVDSSGIAYSGHSSNAARTFKLHANEYLDGDGATAVSPYLLAGDTVFIDPAYTNLDVPSQWLVTAVGTSGANCTMYPLDSACVMTANVPANGYLMVGPNLRGIGTGQPGPRKSGTTSDTFYTAILARTAEIKGGVNAEKLYRNDLDKSGRNTLWSKAQVETEMQLDFDMDKQILLGQINDNTSNAVNADRDSSNQSVRSTKGLWNWIESDGMEQAYAGSYDLAYFDQIKEYLRSQGVTDTTVSFMAGSNLHKQVENTVLDYIKAYSGGSDLVRNLGQVGFNVQSFLKNGITCELAEIVSFDNANTYAVMDTYFRDAGIVIPQSLATISSMGISAGEKVKIPNVAIGYLKGNGEDRERMVHPVAGVNGYGYPAVDQYDDVRLFIKTEFMLIVNLANQMLKIVKEGTY